MFARDVDDLMTTIEATRPSAVVLDREYGDADEVLRRLAMLPTRDQTLVILVFRDALQEPPSGAHVLVLEPALRQALALADSPISIEDRRPLALDRLLTVSVLSGALDAALAAAADEVAAGFGVDRCLIAVRGDSTGGVAVGAHTWDSLTWSQTAERCRAASAAGATLIALAPSRGAPCESYLAVPLADAARQPRLPRARDVEATDLPARGPDRAAGGGVAARRRARLALGTRAHGRRSRSHGQRPVPRSDARDLEPPGRHPPHVGAGVRGRPVEAAALRRGGATWSTSRASTRGTASTPAIACCAGSPRRCARRCAPRTSSAGGRATRWPS